MFLQLDQVSIRYPGATATPAVDAASLGLARGEIGVLIGPSGCGKTSLLRAVAGLERLAHGRIAIDGEALADAAAAAARAPETRRIGMVFQDYALFPHLSVARNVAFGIADLPRAERERRVQRGARPGRPRRTRRSARRTSCRAASSSASRSRARSRRGRACCCSTSRSRAWTSTCASVWRRSCARS